MLDAGCSSLLLIDERSAGLFASNCFGTVFAAVKQFNKS